MSYSRRDLLWNDGEVIHACCGDRMVDSNPETFLVWTLCNKDVPVNKAYEGNPSDATCKNCLPALY